MTIGAKTASLYRCRFIGDGACFANIINRSFWQITWLKKQARRWSSDWISRVKSTRQQVGLTSKERESNVRGAFRLTDKFLERYQGEHIVIIDDVVTTGATIEAIARCFPAKYRDKVNVLSFARVVSDPIGAI